MKFAKILTIFSLLFLIVSCGQKLGEGETPADYRARLEKKGVKFMPGLYVRAAANNDTATVRMFLKAQMEVDKPDASGNSALVLAVNKGHVEMTKLLIEAGADIFAKSNKGLTPLEDACALGRLEVVKVIVEYLKANNPDGLLAAEASLIWASRQGRIEIVKYLVENGVNMEGKTVEGWTPLTWASKTGHLPVVEFLLEKGAKVNEKDRDGYTALDWAKNENYTKVIRVLKRHGGKGYAKF